MAQAQEQLEHVDAVMIGRLAYDNPWQFVDADRLFFNDNHDVPTRHEVAEKMLIYIEEQMKKGVRMMSITRHILQLFSGQPGARHWRRSLGKPSSNRNPDIARVRDLLLRPQLVR